MADATIFSPPAQIPGLSPESQRSIIFAFRQLATVLSDLASPPERITTLKSANYTSHVGELVPVAPPATGMLLLLPPGNSGNASKRVHVAVESVATGGSVTIAVNGTQKINGSNTIVLTKVGLSEFVSLGRDGWSFQRFPNAVALSDLESVPRLRLIGTAVTAGSTPTPPTALTGGNAGLILRYLGTIAPSNLSSPQNNLGEATFGAGVNYWINSSVLFLQTTADLDITGLDASPIIPGDAGTTVIGVGKLVFLLNSSNSTKNINLLHANAGSSSINRFKCPRGQPFQMRPSEACIVINQGINGWLLVGLAMAVDIQDLAAESNGEGVRAHKRVAFTASGAAGVKIDVALYTAAVPFNMRLVDASLLLSVAGPALSTAALFDGAGGAGTQLTSAFATTVTGTARNNDTVTRVLAQNSTVNLNIDRSCTGEILMEFVRA